METVFQTILNRKIARFHTKKVGDSYTLEGFVPEIWASKRPIESNVKNAKSIFKQLLFFNIALYGAFRGPYLWKEVL